MSEFRERQPKIAQLVDHMRKVFPNSNVRVVALIERNREDDSFIEHGKVDDAMRRTALDAFREPLLPESADD